MKKPPLIILDPHYVVEYAKTNKRYRLSKKRKLNVNGKNVGKVTRMAICKKVGKEEYFLLHCNKKWEVVYAFDYFDALSLMDAKLLAESHYTGIDKNWIKTSYTEKQAKKYLSKQQKKIEKTKCSFCGSKQFDDGIKQIICSEIACICNKCIIEFNQLLNEEI